MALFGKGASSQGMPAMPMQHSVPVEQVLAMQQQGFVQDQIVQALQRDGYDMSSINDALSQAQAKGGVEPVMPQQDFGEFGGGSFGAPMGMQQNMSSQGVNVEEVAESIIEEKWSELQQELHKFAEWKEQTNARLDRVEKVMSDLTRDFDKLHTAIIGKIGDYDKTLLDVGTDIKAMEKVFQKVLPKLTESIDELKDVTAEVKGMKRAPAMSKPVPRKLEDHADDEEADA